MTSPADDNLWFTAIEHYRAGRFADCESACLQLGGRSSRYIKAVLLLGIARFRQNRLDGAIAAFEKAISLDPQLIEARTHLASALIADGRPEEAVDCYERLLRLDPNHLESLNNLGGLYVELMQYDKAQAVLERLLDIHPDIAEAHNNLGSLHISCGRLERALRHHRRAIEINPLLATAQSNLLYALLYSDALSPQQVFQEHIDWASRHTTASAGLGRSKHIPTDPARALRIGYLSPDLRNHPVAAFLEPVLAHHDPQRYQIICYQDSPLADATTARLKSHSLHWRETFGLSDDQLEQQITQDRIDILIDLAVHSGRNRLPLFARKPAPILMTYLGYAFTTGVGVVDYRITDAILDPPGLTESFHTERLLRLPNIFWCFRPPTNSPPITPLPALGNGHITFGSANRLVKITPSVLACWSRVMQQIPSAKLRLIAPELRTDSVRAEIITLLNNSHIDASRVSLVGSLPLENFLAAVGEFDIALDTFPFTGGSTSCHTLWMGVPVVTRTGQTSLTRVSATILSSIGQNDLIASTQDEFVSIATALASDIPALAARRDQMRSRMQDSPLMREAAFVKTLEAAFRLAWQEACAQSIPV